MEDADIDPSTDILNPETNSEDSAPVRKPFWLVPLVGLLFLALALFLVIGNSGRASKQYEGPSEIFLDYQSLSNEMHTGLRLARLEDFVAQHSDSYLAGAALARRDALKNHEEIAWARLTDTFYDTDADEVAKTLAIKAYTNVWTPLHRPEQLKTLGQDLPNDAVPNFKPGERTSRFASGGNDQFLEGGPSISGQGFRRTFGTNVEMDRLDPSHIVPPRIRYKRQPAYPSKARRRRIEADVVIELDIDDRGRVAQTRVISVHADRYAKDFAKAATRAARRTRFHPKTIGGHPVATSRYVQRYAFRNER